MGILTVCQCYVWRMEMNWETANERRISDRSNDDGRKEIPTATTKLHIIKAKHNGCLKCRSSSYEEREREKKHKMCLHARYIYQELNTVYSQRTHNTHIQNVLRTRLHSFKPTFICIHTRSYMFVFVVMVAACMRACVRASYINAIWMNANVFSAY